MVYLLLVSTEVNLIEYTALRPEAIESSLPVCALLDKVSPVDIAEPATTPTMEQAGPCHPNKLYQSNVAY